jgi:Zn finger protein HypA/HybF involved in hydrogenase expression
MKNILLTLILTLAFGTFFQAQAQTSQDLNLRIGKQRVVTKDKLKIKFVSVVEDSRCAEGMTCIWAGSAKVKIQLTSKKGGTKIFALSTNLDPKTIKFDGYEVKLNDLTPAPKTNIRIDPNGYTASFTITKL